MAEQNLAMHVQRSRSGNATEVEGGIFDKADRYLSELGRWYRRLSAPVLIVPLGTYQRISSHCYSSLLECRSDTSLSRTRRLSLVEFSDNDVTVENLRVSSPKCPTTEDNGIESSMEIDTSSLSCDWSNHPHCDHPCSGSYQPLPPESLQNIHSRASPGCMKYISVSRPVWRAIVYGQLMSLLLCAMAVSSYYLNSVHHLVMPTGQSFLHYSLMCMIYTTWLACRSGENGLVSVLRRRGWRYLLIALADVEASTLLITAHQFTTLTSIQLLDCVSIPAALALSCLLLRVRYKIVHIVGVGVCLMGVGCLVWADIEDGRPLAGGKDRLLGDMLCLGGAILFSVITVAEEYTVKTFDWVEYLGMVGLFGSVFNGLQLALLEKQEVSTLKWDSISMISLLVGFGLAQFLFHSIAPTVLKDSGATALQLSLLTADFYSLIVGIILLQYKFHALYFLSFTLTMTGVLLYAIKQTPISSQQTTSYRGMPRNHTSSFNLELAPTTTPVSGHASVSLSRATLAGSTDTGLSGSGISQGLRMNGVTVY